MRRLGGGDAAAWRGPQGGGPGGRSGFHRHSHSRAFRTHGKVVHIRPVPLCLSLRCHWRLWLRELGLSCHIHPRLRPPLPTSASTPRPPTPDACCLLRYTSLYQSLQPPASNPATSAPAYLTPQQSAQKRALDVLNTVGLGESLLRLIERRQRMDMWTAYGGMVRA